MAYQVIEREYQLNIQPTPENVQRFKRIISDVDEGFFTIPIETKVLTTQRVKQTRTADRMNPSEFEVTDIAISYIVEGIQITDEDLVKYFENEIHKHERV